MQPDTQSSWLIRSLLVIVGCLVGSSVTYITGMDYVTDEEVRKIVMAEAPYSRDQKAIEVSLQNILIRMDRLKQGLESQAERWNDFETRITRLEVKLDVLISEKQ